MVDEPRVRIEMWSDVVCPFCWIGKRHLEEALRQTGMRDKVDLVHRAFQLNPGLKGPMPLRRYLDARFGGPEGAARMIEHVRRMGSAAGLRLDFENAIAAPTHDAHRLARLATRHGKGDAMVERLMKAHFEEGLDVSDRPTLRSLAEQVGLDGDEVARLLAGDEHAAEVQLDQAAAQRIGAGGVPFFLLNGRYGVSGAQPVELFVRALERARADSPQQP